MSTLETNTIKPISGSSTLTLGESGDTVSLGTGVTAGTGISDGKILISAQDTTKNYLQSKIVAGSGMNITLNGAGSNESITFASSGKMVLLQSASTQTNAGNVTFDQVFDKDIYSFYRLVGWFRPVTNGSDMEFRWRSSSADLSAAEYYGVVQGKTVNGSGVGDLIWSRWGGNSGKITNDAANSAYNGLIIDMVLRPRFASGTSTTNSANITFQGGYWQNNGGSERALSMHGHYTYTNSSADMDNGGFKLFPSSGDFDEFEYVLYGITQS